MVGITKTFLRIKRLGRFVAHGPDEHHRNELGMVLIYSERASYHLPKGNNLKRLSGSYVNDILRWGDNQFRERCTATAKKLDVKDEDERPCSSTCFLIAPRPFDDISICRTDYANKLRLMQTDGSYFLSRSVRMKLACLSHTRPDTLFEVSQLSQVTSVRFDEEPKRYIRDSNKVRKPVKHRQVRIALRVLERSTPPLRGISYAAFSNNNAQSSQWGYLPFLRDVNCTIILMR